MGEKGFNVNKEPGEIITEKGVESIPNVTCAEKGQHGTIAGASNAAFGSYHRWLHCRVRARRKTGASAHLQYVKFI
jgi:hypothetical protein